MHVHQHTVLLPRHHAGLFLFTSLVFAACGCLAAPPEERSELAPLAGQSLLLDGSCKDGLMVVVGERGHILIGEENGHYWKQVITPTRATLTACWFADAKKGWAVGHDLVILRTVDGAQTWERVYADPERERPFLDVWFKDENHGMAVGAYSTIMVTSDGGATWQERPFELVQDEVDESAAEDDWDDDFGVEYHLNRIGVTPLGVIYLAAEAGMLYRSTNDGETWTELPSPYEGSFFGILPLNEDVILAMGLRGHLFRSQDAGQTWIAIPTNTEAMLTDAIMTEDGTIVVVGLAGTVLFSRDQGQTLDAHAQPDRKGYEAVMQAPNADLFLIGEVGVTRLNP